MLKLSHYPYPGAGIVPTSVLTLARVVVRTKEWQDH